MHHIEADKTHREKKTIRGLHKNATSYIEQIMEATLHETIAVRPLTFHLLYKSSKTNKTCRTLLEKKARTHVTFSKGPLHMVMPVLADPQELTFAQSDWAVEYIDCFSAEG